MSDIYPEETDEVTVTEQSNSTLREIFTSATSNLVAPEEPEAEEDDTAEREEALEALKDAIAHDD